MTKHHINILILIIAVMLISCKNSQTAAEQSALQWGEAYFNYNFFEAAKHATPESERWLRFAASNVTQQDLDALSSNGRAEVILDGYYAGADSTGIAYLRVNNWLCMDSIGSAGSRIGSCEFQVLLIKREGRWLVRMEGLPQSEKQNRD